MAYNIVGNGYNYLGVTAVTPPNLQINPNAPTINNMNAKIGDFWLQQDTTNLWFLTSLANQQAVWTPIGGGGGGTITAVDSGDNITVNTVGTVATVNLKTSILQPSTSVDGSQGVYALGSSDYVTDRFLHNAGSVSLYLGYQAGNLDNIGVNNVIVGAEGGQSFIHGSYNTGIGDGVLKNSTESNNNVAVGLGSLQSATASNFNSCVGFYSGQRLIDGSFNTIIGTSAGYNYTSNESSNVLIHNLGVTAESHVIRIGLEGSGSGEQNKAYIAGIYNKTVDAGTQQVVVIDSDGKLGSIVGGGGDITDVNSGDNITVNTVGTVATVNLNKSISQPTANGLGTEGVYNLGGFRFMHDYGTRNTFLGKFAGNFSLTGVDDTACGNLAGGQLTSGSENSFFGAGSGKSLVSGDKNSFFGFLSGFNSTSAEKNVYLGVQSGYDGTTASSNIFIGWQSGLLNVSGNENVAIGVQSLSACTLPSKNLVLGYQSGNTYLTNESNNILLSHTGIVGDNNVMRLGEDGTGDFQVDSAYIAGTYARTVDGGSQQFVVIDSVGKLGSVIGGGGGGDVNTLTGDTGPAVTSTGNNIDVNGGDNINTSGAASTLTINLDTSISQPNTNASGTEGVYSLGFSRFMHNYGTNNTFVGSISGNLTLTGEMNSCFGNSSGNGLTSGKNNSFFGHQSGTRTTSGKYNSYFGLTSGSGNYTGNYNCAFGATALGLAENSEYNVAIGWGSLIGIISGVSNVAVGSRSGGQLGSSASNNILIGDDGGFGLTGTESNNIIIGNQGAVGDNNTIRIGDQGSGDFQQNRTYIAGIYNNSVDAGTQQTVVIDSTGKLGSAVSSIPVVDGCISWTGKAVNGATAPVYYECSISAKTTDATPLEIFTLPYVGSYNLFTANIVCAGYGPGGSKRTARVSQWVSNSSAFLPFNSSGSGNGQIDINYADSTVDVTGVNAEDWYWSLQIQLSVVPV